MGERTTQGTRSDADSHSYIAQLAPQEKKKNTGKKAYGKKSYLCDFIAPTKRKFIPGSFK